VCEEGRCSPRGVPSSSLKSLTKERKGSGGGGGSCCTLLCPRVVTDVRRNVWVVWSLQRVPVEPHQCKTHPVPQLWLDKKAKWCEARSSPTSSITPPQPIPPVCLSVKR